MTNAELNARAAEIMGYAAIPWDNNPNDLCYRDQFGTLCAWNPAENIAQAFELAEKSGKLQLTQWDMWRARIVPQNTNPVKYGEGDTPALAITRACVAAAEKKC